MHITYSQKNRNCVHCFSCYDTDGFYMEKHGKIHTGEEAEFQEEHHDSWCVETEANSSSVATDLKWIYLYWVPGNNDKKKYFGHPCTKKPYLSPRLEQGYFKCIPLSS